ncbi:iron complex outermembrane recepter protein [Vibrio crassostreae]|uniref:TonB-dependent siderophore receptor n=1 Tax=Vibrio crassostreae TaxID=246167 RepID=UPI0005E7EE7F|nr:TonB-dependent siderophore receptor [Vibrio crassostreae]TCT57494.1 iron complex outermembrane receptor protein [Vibrio crassostreae]TCT77910.1 iron complex outermembrane receptor protein [Vibrio crassostreae]TCT99983.1 iron complex outermembrane receptor protein [Vibrio crassostreae]TDW04428.1 iron complex outermembrane receptor protein [Vibrio crassostreae]CAK1706268.1 iron complex outermembrane recepter protein [Vibrio crassostreae]
MTTHTRFKYSLLAVALLTAFSAQALAEETATAADSNVETVTIMGKAYRNTATKSALEPEETPQGITVIDEEQLEQRGVKSLNQALRYAPGVVTEQKGASVTMYDTFSIRGFSNNQSYYDGLVLPFLTGWNLQPQIDPIAIQQVEVFKGPTSVLYGAMPPGGMVNMIAKTPQEDGATKVGVSTGSRNLMEASIDTTGQLGDSGFSYRLVALARKQDSQVDHAEEERYVIAPSLDWQVSDRTLINFNLYYQNDPSMGTNSAMPLEVLKASDPSVSMGDKSWSTFEREVLMLGYKINHQINDNWTFLQNARYTDASLYQENTYHTATNFNPATGSLIRNAYSTDEDSQSFILDNQVSGRLEISGLEHNLLFGVDYLKLTGDSLYKEFTANAGFYGFDAYNPNNDLLDKSQLQENYRESHDITTEQLGLYFQDQVRYDALVLLAGGRYDMFKASDDKNSSYPTYDGKEEADHNQFSYRVGALYELDNGISPFVSYATSFEPAAGTDINGNSLKPQLGEQVELGIKYLSPDMSQQVTASYFHITKKDSIAADPSDPTYRSKIQLGEVRSQGVEVEGRWFVTEDWDVNASYTYVDMEVTEDANPDLEGTTPIYVPTHAANLWSNYYVYGGALAGTRWSAGARYMGEMELDATNTQGKVPSYTVVDLSLGYDLGEVSDTLSGATANLMVNNLFNEEYYTCYDQSNCWFGAEQSVELSVNYQF